MIELRSLRIPVKIIILKSPASEENFRPFFITFYNITDLITFAMQLLFSEGIF